MPDIVYGKKNVFLEEKPSQINQQCCIELAGNFLKLFDTGLIMIRDIVPTNYFYDNFKFVDD